MTNAFAPVDPILWTEPIVTSDGFATEYLLRQLFTQRELNQETGVATSDTGVDPGTFGSATTTPKIVVDQKGRIISAENVSSATGSNAFSWSGDNLSTGFNAAAFATKGSVVTFFKNVQVSSLMTRVDATSGHTYKAYVIEIDGAGVIQNIVASTGTTASATAALQLEERIIASMRSGVRYFVGFGRTDGADTFAFPINIIGGATSVQTMFRGFPVELFTEAQVSTFGRIAKAVPAVGDTITAGSGSFLMGIQGSFG